MFQIFKFNGGVKPPSHKTQSVTEPVGIAPLPSRLVVPLHQSIGGTPRPVVQAGDKVLKGQLIGEADGWISAAVHAPTSGTVRDVGMYVQPHPSGLSAASVVIEPDGKDEWIERVPVDYRKLSLPEVQKALQQAGIVGLGGAAFPAHGKLVAPAQNPIDTLVINGGECEPFITCDDMLMRERAEGVVRGTAIYRDLLQARQVLIGIEDNKPEAVAAMREAVARLGEDFRVVAVPAIYPAGSAKQLIRMLTGKEVPSGKLPTTIGIQCYNVATAYATWRAIEFGEPLISRLLTLSGNVERPRNWEVLVGTPIDELLALAAPKADTDGVIMGGPMMGFAVPDSQVSIIKASNCLIARSPGLFPPALPEMPCIRCGECARSCPADLQPYEMYWFARAKNFGKAQEYHVFDCIECGCCSFVCPSHIPLVQYFRFAKSEIWARERDKQAADTAKNRYEFKKEREEREKAEKAEKLAKAAAAQAAKKAAEQAAEHAGAAADVAPATAVTPSADDPEAAKKAAIAAAMERAAAQRAAVQPQNTDTLTPDQQQEIDRIEARRAQAGIGEDAAASEKTQP